MYSVLYIIIRYIYNVEGTRRSFECLKRKKGKLGARMGKDRHEYMIHTYIHTYIHTRVYIYALYVCIYSKYISVCICVVYPLRDDTI